MKRLVSMILAIAMLISLLPAISADSTAPVAEQMFDFTGKSVKLVEVAADGAAPEGYSEKWEFEGTKYYINSEYSAFAENRNWRIMDINEDIVKLVPIAAKFGLHSTNGIVASCGSGSNLNKAFKFAVSMKPEATGFYVPFLKAYCGSGAFKFKWYLDEYETGKETLDNYGKNLLSELTSIAKTGTFYCGVAVADADSKNRAAVDQVIYAEKDKELVSVIDGNTKNFRFYNVHLEPVVGAEIAIKVNDSVDNFELDTEGNTTASITSTLINGTVNTEKLVEEVSPTDSSKTVLNSYAVNNVAVSLPLSGEFSDSVVYKSSATNVATVDATTGVITAVGGGEAEIYAESRDGSVTSNRIKVSVSGPVVEPDDDDEEENVVLSDVEILYDISGYVGIRNDLSVPFATLTYEKTKGFWEYAANRRHVYSWDETGKDNITTSGEDLNWVREKGIAIRTRNNWWAIKVNVPKSGYYTPKAYYATYKNGGFNVYMNYYMLPVTESGASVDLADSAFATEDNLIGRVNCTNTEVADVTMCDAPAVFKAKHLEKGEYYVIFYPTCTDEGKSGTLRGLVSDFVLDGGDKAVPMSVEVSGIDALDLDATVYLSDGTTSDTVIFKSENEEIATISADGKITPVSNGTVDITVTAENLGVSVSKTVSIAVEVTGENPGGGENPEGGENPDGEDDENVVLSDVEVVYDISSYVGMRNDLSVPFSSLTYEKTKGFWEYAANYRNYYSWTENGIDNITTSGEDLNWVKGKGIAIRDRKNWWAIKVNVPVSGYYEPKAYYGTYTNGGFNVYMNYYMLPVTEGGVSVDLADSAFATAKNLIGSVNCTNTEVESGTMSEEPATFKAKYIEKGEYYVAFIPSCTDEGKTGTLRGLVSDFVLDGGDKAVPMNIEISGEKILDLEAIVYLSDGTTTNNVTYKSENEAIATIDENGVITVLENGIVGITVTAENDGFTYSKTFNIEAKLPEIPGISVTYDIASRVGGRNDPTIKFTDFTYATNNDMWEYAANRRARYSWAENGYDTITTSGEDFNYLAGKGLGIRVRSNWWAIKIKVPKSGLYLPKMSYVTYTNSGTVNGVSQKVDVYMQYYLIPVTEEVRDDGVIPELENSKFIDGDHLIGMINATDTESSLVKTGHLKKINIDVGEYYLVFNPVTDPALAGQSISGTMRAGVSNITLDGINCIQELYAEAKTDIDWDEESKITFTALRLDGTEVTDYKVTYSSSNPEYATVSEDGVIKGVGEGSSVVTMTVDDGVGSISKTFNVNVTDNTGAKEFLLNLGEKLYVNETLLLDVDAVMNSGNVLDVSGEFITYSCYPENIVKIEDGIITALSEGEATVTTTVNYRGLEKTFENTVTVIVGEGKTEPTLYTYEMRQNAQENIAKYEWAKSTQKNAIKSAEKLLPHVDVIKNQILGEGLPRANQLGVRGDDYYQYCRYCHEIIVGDYDLAINHTSRPWKVQCTACKRVFPSNNFEGFLKLGLDSTGRYFDVDRARLAHHKMLFHKDGGECTCTAPTEEGSYEWYLFYGYGNPEGYLHNDLYPEIVKSNLDPWGDKITWNIDENGNNLGADLGTYKDENGNVLWTGGSMWGVDDGWGYRPGRIYTDGLEERIGYIARYNYEFWMWMYGRIGDLANAYLYTGEAKYGRAGAIIFDRVADIWDSLDMYYFKNKFFNTHGGSGYGAAVGRINDSYIGRGLVYSADMLYPMIYDEQLIRILNADAEASGLENKKSGSEEIWKNWEEGIVLSCFKMCTDGRINGNFGQPQGVAGIAAIVVGKQPETNNILNWIYATDTGNGKTVITGGNLNATLINRVDRDGMGDEASPRYNTSWLSNLLTFANATSMYKGEGDYQPYQVPKFLKMYSPQIDILIQDSKHPNIGDAGSVASVTRSGSTNVWLEAFALMDNEYYKKKIANFLYTVNGNKTDGFKYDIFTEDPESAEDDILEYVDTSYKKPESTILTGYGVAILRDGSKYDSASSLTEKNNMRDIWVSFGRTASHGHSDPLNLGMDAYGLDIAPDLGYPEATSYTPNRGQWVSATISHNTVIVNEANPDLDIVHGYPLHFDDTEMVKLIDVDESNRNSLTENFRRSVVMIKANDDVSYAVDFFRVMGGNTHTYSFHSQAENAYPISGIELTPQVDENGDWIGTYAGVDGKDPETGEWIAYGPDPYTTDAWGSPVKYSRGYTWMSKIRKDKAPEDIISVEFDVKDYNRVLKDSNGIKLRLTQMNNFTPDEVAIVAGYVPIKEETKKLPRNLDYLLVHNRGENLDSLFTTILEPYKGERYLSDIKPVEVTGEGGNADDMVRAVKVMHTNGRCDYVVYATNNSVTYTVNDTHTLRDGTEIPVNFDFRGFVGVYTLNENGAVIYRYVTDGDIIGKETGKATGYSGKVTSFQKGNEVENYIDVEIDCDDLSDLEGRVIYINNDRVENGAYRIISATKEAEGLAEGSVRLDIGTVTLIRSLIDKYDFDKGFVYNIKEGQTFYIPTSFADEKLPEFEPMPDDLGVTVGSLIKVNVQAKSPIDVDTPSITYIGESIPRGATLDPVTGDITWKPTSSQIGENHVAVTARDEDGRESTLHFTIAVYGSTTGDVGTGNSAGGGGGGAAPTTPATPTTPTTPTEPDEPTTPTVPTTPDVEMTTERFVDLTNHAWACDAINALADAGIIKGTSENTFSPAANITRADFTILLVRAFELASDNTENFSDVAESDYFAKELAIARNTGIVNGIGDNKYAPRNPITRQDMMTIVYRAMTALEINVGEAQESPANADFDDVASYAKDAVSALISAELVNGKNGLIAPTDYTTRAEVAVLIKRILDYNASLK